MSDKLAVVEAQIATGDPHEGVCIAWTLDDGDVGYVVGTDLPQKIRRTSDPEDALTFFAEEEARQCVGERAYFVCGGALVFETPKGARAVLAKAKARLASWKSKKPWPKWAIQAKAAGWKMPKGWAP